MKTYTKTALLSTLLALPSLSAQEAVETTLTLNPLTSIRTGIFDESAAEIVAFDRDSNRLFIVNGANNTIDIADISDPEDVIVLDSILITGSGSINSLAVKNGLVAAAIEGESAYERGVVRTFTTEGEFVREYRVGFQPDMVTFTPDGQKLLVANEGEIADSGDPSSFDPEGSISVIDLRVPVRKRGYYFWSAYRAQRAVTEIFFRKFDAPRRRARLDPSIRASITPGSRVSQDLEPEFIAVSADSQTAWVSLQENNALAILNLRKNTVESLVGLGFKNHSQNGNGLDASNEDEEINIQPWPVLGLYQPDTIATYQAQGETFVVTANEGDARDFEEARVRDLELDPVAFPDREFLQVDENLGRLRTTTANGQIDGNETFDRIFSFGGRSFSIHNARGQRIYDSGDEFEQVLAEELPEAFNANNDDNDSFDNRSDDRGPEPEALAVGEVEGRNYAFIGLERVGGIMIYDITNPFSPFFVSYQTQRDFSGDPEEDTAGDLGPEGMTFIPRSQSPNGKPLLVVAYEVSGSTTVFEVNLTTLP